MKITALMSRHFIAMLGLTLLSFCACKKDSQVEQSTQTGSVSLAGNLAPTFKASAPISLYNEKNVTISGISTTSISLSNCSDITILNCKVGPNSDVGINIFNCTNVRVSGTYIYNVSTGVEAIQSQGINVSGNYALNMQGPYPKGEFVQFDNVTGTGNRINSNQFQNILGQSNPIDGISIYESSGTAADPIQVNLNKIRGGGPASNGGGIMLGDGGGSYVTAEWNTLVDPGQYGMAVSGGTHMTIYQNNIYGKQQSFTNVGIYYWNQSGKPSSAITISSNNVNYTKNDGELSNTYLPNDSLAPTGWSTNSYDKALGESTLPTTLVTIP